MKQNYYPHFTDEESKAEGLSTSEVTSKSSG